MRLMGQNPAKAELQAMINDVDYRKFWSYMAARARQGTDEELIQAFKAFLGLTDEEMDRMIRMVATRRT